MHQFYINEHYLLRKKFILVFLGLFGFILLFFGEWGVYLVYLGLIGVQIVKIFVLKYVGRVFQNLEKKIQGSQIIKNFWRFRVFVLRYIANSKRRKRREI